MDAIIAKLDTIAELLERIATALENQKTDPTPEDVERRISEGAIHAGPNGLGVTS